MEITGNDMEITRMWLERIRLRVCREPLPGILYVGPVGATIQNPPIAAVQFCFMTDGVFRDLRVGALAHELRAGDVALLNMHFGIATTVTPGATNWNLYLDMTGDPLHAALAAAPLLRVWHTSSRERLLTAFRTVAARHSPAPPAFWRYMSHGPNIPPALSVNTSAAAAVFLQAALLELLAIMLDDVQSDASTRLTPAVQAAVDFMVAHYADPALDLQAIACAGQLSPSQLRRLFSRELHTSPMRLLHGMRLMHGRVLLEQTSLRIGEIAAGVGFADPLYFSRAFHAETGCSPQAYRQRLGK